jgi:hypothetical protein
MKLRTTPYALLLAGALTLLGAAACSDLNTAPEPAVATTIQLVTADVRLGSLGERMPLEARVLDQNGREIPGASGSLVWTVVDPSVATVSPTRELIAQGNGETLVRVRYVSAGGRATPSGYLSGLADGELRVTVRQDVGGVRLASGTGPVTFWALGQTQSLEAQVTDPLGNPLARPVEIRWESANAEVVAVSGSGQLEAVGDGATEIRALVEGTQVALDVRVEATFSFGACVSSSASRAAARIGGGDNGDNGGSGSSGADSSAAAGCAETQLRARVGATTP